MIKPFQIAFVLLLPVSPLLGQNWSTFRDTGVNYYAQSVFPAKVYSLKVVSKQAGVGGDTLFYFNPELFVNPNGTQPWCNVSNHTSFMAQMVLRKVDGDEIYVNILNDSLVIKTRAGLGHSWDFFRYASGAKVIATVSEMKLVDFYGETDSLKTITLTYYDSLGAVSIKPYSNMQLSWTRKHGWYQADLLRTFPHADNKNSDFVPTRLKLIGQTLPGKGAYLNMTDAIYRHEVGDEWHETENNLRQGVNRKRIKKVTAKNCTQLGCIYKVHVLEKRYEYWEVDTVYDQTDTVLNAEGMLTGYPLSVSINLFDTFTSKYYFRLTNMVNRGNGDSCVIPESWNAGSHTYTDDMYLQGFGYYYHTWNMVGDINNSLNLVYFKTASEEWGKKLASNEEEFFKGRKFKTLPAQVTFYAPKGGQPYPKLTFNTVKTDTFVWGRVYHNMFGKSPKPGCVDVTLSYSSWMGPATIETDTGYTWYYNYQMEPIAICSRANEGETWIAYRYPDGSYIKGFVYLSLWMSNPTGLDSLKVITFRYYDAGGARVPHLLDGVQLRLSRNSGFFDVLNWNRFPADATVYSLTDGPFIENPLVNNTGDIVHMLEYDIPARKTKKIIRHYNSVKKLADTTFQRVYSECVRTDSAGHKLPFQQYIVIDTFYTKTAIIYPGVTDTIAATAKEVTNQTVDYAFGGAYSNQFVDVQHFRNLGSDCWTKDSGATVTCSFHPDFGKLYCERNAQGDTLRYNNPSYFSGTYYHYGVMLAQNCDDLDTSVILSTPQIAATESDQQIYPNPACSYFNLPANVQHYQVCNAKGVWVLSGNATPQVDVRGLPAGIYLVRLTTAANVFYHRRLLILH